MKRQDACEGLKVTCAQTKIARKAGTGGGEWRQELLRLFLAGRRGPPEDPGRAATLQGTRNGKKCSYTTDRSPYSSSLLLSLTSIEDN